MPIILFTAGQIASPTDVNANFGLCVLTDTSRTVTVTHTWTASQTFAGGVQITGGASAVGSVWKSATSGLVIQAVAGSSFDLFIGNPSATAIMTVATGTLNPLFVGTVSAAGVVASGAVQVTGGASTVGSMWKSATGGLVLQGVAGSSTDFFLGNPGASPIMTVPTGTVNVVFAGSITGNVTGNVSGTAATVTTAAQPSITSVGTLTSLTVSGTVTLTAANSKIVPGVSSIAFRNNADSAGNLTISDAGLITFRSGLTISSVASLNLIASTTAEPSLFMPAGVAPSIPAAGSMWYDGTNVKFQTGAGTKTFTLV